MAGLSWEGDCIMNHNMVIFSLKLITCLYLCHSLSQCFDREAWASRHRGSKINTAGSSFRWMSFSGNLGSMYFTHLLFFSLHFSLNQWFLPGFRLSFCNMFPLCLKHLYLCKYTYSIPSTQQIIPCTSMQCHYDIHSFHTYMPYSIYLPPNPHPSFFLFLAMLSFSTSPYIISPNEAS